MSRAICEDNEIHILFEQNEQELHYRHDRIQPIPNLQYQFLRL